MEAVKRLLGQWYGPGDDGGHEGQSGQVWSRDTARNEIGERFGEAFFGRTRVESREDLNASPSATMTLRGGAGRLWSKRG